ncbi:MAG: hypothetical protein OEX02_11175 [Cyclobacteriaceae bacterium]|nr:hypothetical protein [Cyclobacteriaceae bacterium]
MTETDTSFEEIQPKTRTLKDLVNTPFKKAMFVVQLISYVLIVGSPAIGAYTGNLFDLDAIKTGSVIFGVFIAGEILFYGSLFFLGKELLVMIKGNVKKWFRKNIK